MDAVTLLNQHIDIQKLLEHYKFDQTTPDGGMLRSCCKIHGGDNPSGFVINPENGLWYCHTGGCGGGDAYILIQKMEEVSFPESVTILADILGINIDTLEVIERKPKHQDDLKRWLNAMRKQQQKIVTNHFTIPERIKEVKKYRSFKYETLQHFRLGYVESVKLTSRKNQDYTLKDRLVFPIVFEEKQIAMSFRKIRATDVPKWSHQPLGFESRHFLYNYDSTYGKQVIVIVEGFLDVWAYHEIGITAIATFGAHITDEQYRLLMRTGADLVFSFDGDDAGQLATKKAIEMFRNKANMYVVNFANDEDPENISREELILRYGNKKRVS